MTSKLTTHVIIPAAGFGKRVGKKTSKELLYYGRDSYRLIEWSLELCRQSHLKPIVISRKSKKDLNDFLVHNYKNVEVFQIDESEEWTHTMQLSEPVWADKNILVLPDSRFKPRDILTQIDSGLNTSDLSFGVFPVQDKSIWGIVRIDKNKVSIAEKPKNFSAEVPHSEDVNLLAWGVLGFRRFAGKNLFEQMRQSSKDHFYKDFSSYSASIFNLKSFEDLTRTSVNLFETSKF